MTTHDQICAVLQRFDQETENANEHSHTGSLTDVPARLSRVGFSDEQILSVLREVTSAVRQSLRLE